MPAHGMAKQEGFARVSRSDPVHEPRQVVNIGIEIVDMTLMRVGRHAV